MSSTKATEKAEAIAKLRELLPPGSTVYTILRHVSRSGMQRKVSVVVFKDGYDLHPNWSVSKAIGIRLDRSGGHDALVMNGCGYDVGYEIVEHLNYALEYKGDNALRQRWL